MRVFRKIALIAAGVLLLLILVPGSYALLRQEHLTNSIVRKVNESVNTKISYGNLHVTIFESFPNITVRFNDLLVEPSPFYDKKQLSHEDNDTLLYASSLSLTVSTPSLLTSTVAVKSITARNGEVNLLTDKRGDINYEVFSEKKGDGKNLRLKNISAIDIRTVYNDISTGMRMAGRIGDATLGGELFGTGIYLNTALNAEIDSINLEKITMRDIPVEAGIRLRKSASSLSVVKGSLSIADLRFEMTGNVNYSSSTLNLVIEGRKINIASVISRLPDRWKTVTGNFSPSGIIDLKCSITGPYGDAGKPHIDLTYGLERGRMSLSPSGFRVNNLEFSGALTNGDHNSAETFRFTVDKLTARYGSASVKGSFMMNNLRRPHITLNLNGDLDFDDLDKIFRSGYIKDQTGLLSGSIRLSGMLPDSILPATSLAFLNPDISLFFREFGATLAGSRLAIKDVTGSLSVKNDLIADNLSFTFLDQRFTVNTVMKNFFSWMAGGGQSLDISGDIHVDRLVTMALLPAKREQPDSTGKPVNLFPAAVSANILLKADSLIFNDFRAANFSSRLTYRPYVITFDEVNAIGLDGVLDGELMLGRQQDGGYITKASLDVKNVDINQAFTSFNNFGQNFIVSDNLRGRLTGKVTMLSPLDSNYRFIRKAIVAESHLVINDGKLISFPPAESLSAYLDLDELKNISFSKMENDIFINYGTVSIPKMLINSSAVNFTVYGTHGFEGDYIYHVRLLLSEVMSRKARERNRNVSSFGQVKVDGSGKATVPLKIECVNGKTSVGYDFGQAHDNIKNDIAAEKQALKGILNEEYGWYSSDTTRTTPVESKPKFSITWEEGKEQPDVAEPQKEEVKESPFKILLKKKR